MGPPLLPLPHLRRVPSPGKVLCSLDGGPLPGRGCRAGTGQPGLGLTSHHTHGAERVDGPLAGPEGGAERQRAHAGGQQLHLSTATPAENPSETQPSPENAGHVAGAGGGPGPQPGNSGGQGRLSPAVRRRKAEMLWTESPQPSALTERHPPGSGPRRGPFAGFRSPCKKEEPVQGAQRGPCAQGPGSVTVRS